MRSLIIGIVLSTVLIGGCETADRPAEKIVQPSEEEIERYRPAGEEVAVALMGSLKAELSAAIQQGGVVSAVEVCRTRALPVTDAVADSFDMAVSVKRTTFRYRNPQNAPDEAERQALEHFEEVLAREESLPTSYMQKIDRGGDEVYRYYHPMRVQGLCLTCHGARENMTPELRKILDQRYPEDRATGYEDGDFRGLIRVELRPTTTDG